MLTVLLLALFFPKVLLSALSPLLPLVGVLAAQVCGHLSNNSIPLWKCRRNGGIWEPEFRLYTLWFPGFGVLPMALGLFGACLQYHLHYMVLALACFLGGYATNSQ